MRATEEVKTGEAEPRPGSRVSIHYDRSDPTIDRHRRQPHRPQRHALDRGGEAHHRGRRPRWVRGSAVAPPRDRPERSDRRSVEGDRVACLDQPARQFGNAVGPSGGGGSVGEQVDHRRRRPGRRRVAPSGSSGPCPRFAPRCAGCRTRAMPAYAPVGVAERRVPVDSPGRGVRREHRDVVHRQDPGDRDADRRARGDGVRVDPQGRRHHPDDVLPLFVEPVDDLDARCGPNPRRSRPRCRRARGTSRRRSWCRTRHTRRPTGSRRCRPRGTPRPASAPTPMRSRCHRPARSGRTRSRARR